VIGIEIPRTPQELWYNKKDFIQFKNEAKTYTEEISEDQHFIGSNENRSDTPLITNIFLRAISYLRQFFISTPISASDPLEEDLPSPLLPPPPKKKTTIRSQEKNPWMLVSDPILSEEIFSPNPEENRWVLIRKSIISSVPEEQNELSNDVNTNTAENKTVTRATTSIWKRIKKRKELKELKQKLEPT
jgi:hypothetical protein